MPVSLNVSNSLQGLSVQLTEDFQKYPKQIFQPVYIITQTDGMNNWLKYQIANESGIAANFRYLKSQELINEIYFLLGGSSREVLSTEKLSWILFKLLGEQDFQANFREVSSYYCEMSESEVKRMAFAEKVADLFDQYQIYRPEMIRKWNQNNDEKNEDWQAWLWKKSKQLLGEKLPDKTNICTYIINELKNPNQQELLQKKMPVIYLFGLSIITKYHIELYHALAEIVDIRFYLANPAPEQYWFEDRSEKQMVALKRKKVAVPENEIPGNPLLTSWGKVLQETFSLLFEDEATLNAYDFESVEVIPENSLLNKIKADLYTNAPQAGQFEESDLLDGSVTINSCYSPAREVEVLYNYLVQLVHEKKAELSARDIVVMVSDINAYAPYIKAVFDNAPFKFRYSISDETYVDGDTISAALRSLLSLTEDSFTSENVMQILESSYVRKRFGITDIPIIREAVNKANIRFGIENNLEDESKYVSWKYGLKRIMFGICLGSEYEYGEGPESFFPVDAAEGAAIEQLIRFNHFVEMLIEMLTERKQNRTIKDWILFIKNVLDNLVCEPEFSGEEDYYQLARQLGTYNVLNQYFTEPVSYRVFIHNFLQTLGSGTRSGSFGSAGITFCSLIPMRSIPFKVVAMLGLNFDKFPRKDQSVSFDLMETKRQKGDRNIKENDKNLFLESLVAAEDYFYISYVGRNSKDNSDFPPSVLVDELVDYIQSGSDGIKVKDLLIKKHPLHGFSRLYNQKDQRLVTYLNTERQATPVFKETKQENEPLVPSEIPIEKFISFFKNPIKGYYNDVLKIYYNDDDVLLSENELFEINNLDKWAINNTLLISDCNENGSLRGKMVKTGQLPLKNMGEVILENVAEEIADVKKLFEECIGDTKSKNKTVEVSIGETTLKGDLKLYDHKLVEVCFSQSEEKYLIAAYIKYLFAVAAGLKLDLFFISKKNAACNRASQLEKQDAERRLATLIKLYQKGHEMILPFSTEFEIKPNELSNLTEETFKNKLKKKLESDYTPCTEAYIMSEFKKGLFDKADSFENYQLVAQKILEPLTEIFPNY